MMTNTPPTSQKHPYHLTLLPIPPLNIEDDEDNHKYTNGWDMMRPDEKIGDFKVNSTYAF